MDNISIAIMQPYLFPYIGYYQLIKAVDIFVFYDDVNFIKHGWINRNRILINNNDFMFTVPLQKANSFCTIKDTLINSKLYDRWSIKFQHTINQNYKKAPYFTGVNYLVKNIFNKEFNTISELAIESIVATSRYLGLKTIFFTSSERYNNKHLERQERLQNICKSEKANHYINAMGGQELYTKETFKENGIKLNFIKSNPIEYKQFSSEFVSWLSIIDVLMFNSPEETNTMLDKFELV